MAFLTLISSMNNMSSLEWLQLYDAFCKFQCEATKYNVCCYEVDHIEDILLKNCPIPQPKPMKV